MGRLSPGIEVGARLGNAAMQEASRLGRQHVIRDTGTAGTLPEHSDTPRIAAEGLDVRTNPAQHLQLILEAIVAGTVQGLGAEEAQRSQAKVGRNEYDVVVQQEVRAVEAADAGATLPAAAMEPHHHRQRAVHSRRARRVDIQVQAVLAALDDHVAAEGIALQADRGILHGQTLALPRGRRHRWAETKLAQRWLRIGHAHEGPHMATLVGGEVASDQPAAVAQTHVQALRVAAIAGADEESREGETEPGPEPDTCHYCVCIRA